MKRIPRPQYLDAKTLAEDLYGADVFPFLFNRGCGVMVLVNREPALMSYHYSDGVHHHYLHDTAPEAVKILALEVAAGSLSVSN